jgi:hypothetical protein
MWRIKTDQELRELYKYLDIAADIKKNRLGWVGHVVRIDQVRIVKKIFESEPEGSRRKGRPWWWWVEDVEKDMQQMNVKRWRQKAVDREEWASVSKEAKAARGP